MKVTVSGATGFIGRRLVEMLRAENHTVRTLSRGTGGGDFTWDVANAEPPPESIADADAVIHLAGEPVAQRWTPAAKQKIRDSRVHGARHLVHALSTISKRPQVLVCASAIGIYGSRGDEILTEASNPGSGFLPDVCVEWEKHASLAEALGIRVVKIRTGIVLGTTGGALAKMLPAFKAFAGGKMGSGKQWMSWIHLDDLAALFRYALDHPMQGPVNGTAPNPVINTEFTKTLAATLHRPAIFPLPGFALKALFGEMSEVLLGSQRVLPRAAQAGGFQFRYPELAPALEALLA
jgi:uncharacterized protein (TIGR01777 family)